MKDIVKTVMSKKVAHSLGYICQSTVCKKHISSCELLAILKYSIIFNLCHMLGLQFPNPDIVYRWWMCSGFGFGFGLGLPEQKADKESVSGFISPGQLCFLTDASHSGSGDRWKKEKKIAFADFTTVASTGQSVFSSWNKLTKSTIRI